MITERIIITFIICVTIISIFIIVGHYSNKESKQQRLNDIKHIVCCFQTSYIKEFKNEFIGNVKDIKNMINTIIDLTH